MVCLCLSECFDYPFITTSDVNIDVFGGFLVLAGMGSTRVSTEDSSSLVGALDGLAHGQSKGDIVITEHCCIVDVNTATITSGDAPKGQYVYKRHNGSLEFYRC